MNSDRNDGKKTMSNSRYYSNSRAKTSRSINNNDFGNMTWKLRGGPRHKRYFHANSNNESEYYGNNNHWAGRGTGYRGRYSKRGGNACNRRNYSDHSWMKSYEDMIWDKYSNEEVTIDLPKILRKLRSDSMNTRYFSDPTSIQRNVELRKYLKSRGNRSNIASEEKLCSRCFRIHPHKCCVLRRCFICSSRYHSPFDCPWKPVEGKPAKSCKYCEGISYNLNSSFDYSVSRKHVCNNFNNESIDDDFDDIYNDDNLNIIDIDDCMEYNERMYNRMWNHSDCSENKRVAYTKNSRVNNSKGVNPNNNIVSSFVSTESTLNSAITEATTGINATDSTDRTTSVNSDSNNDTLKKKIPFSINFRGRKDIPEDFNSCIRKGYEESILFMADESTVGIREELEIVCYFCSKSGHIICNSTPPFQNCIKKAYCALCGELGHSYELCHKYKRKIEDYYFKEEFEYLLSLEERRCKKEQLKIKDGELEKNIQNRKVKFEIYDDNYLNNGIKTSSSNCEFDKNENFSGEDNADEEESEEGKNSCDDEYEHESEKGSSDTDRDYNDNSNNNIDNRNNKNTNYYHNVGNRRNLINDINSSSYREKKSDHKKFKRDEFQLGCSGNCKAEDSSLDNSSSSNKLIRRNKNGMRWLSGMKSFSRSELISINSVSTIETSEYNKDKSKESNSIRDCEV
ncbi:hypothetical protein FG386_000511 [Cryptosporidium ryanae]|uniref:uncharacterized protein n=1 Tax=Cryptosporidium ryanae TaxID=515981 RepID=UPI00351A8E23|nr:hypothetical protein FG386_000511 [Cryptosporidium ryanae]